LLLSVSHSSLAMSSNPSIDELAAGLESKDPRARTAALEACGAAAAARGLGGGSPDAWLSLARGLAAGLGDANAHAAVRAAGSGAGAGRPAPFRPLPPPCA
jgi:hypothetical protein